MGNGVQFSPSTVFCGVVEPGGKGMGSAACGQLSVPANVTASITSDSSGGRMTIAAVRSYVSSVQTVPGAKGGGYRETVTKQVAKSNGTIPLAVLAGQWVEVDIRFAPTAMTPDLPTATLEITSDVWGAVSLHVTAEVGKLKLDVPTEITVVQNHSQRVPVKVTWVAGPTTTAKLILGPAIPSLPFDMHLTKDTYKVGKDHPTPTPGWLVVQADLTVPVGTYSYSLSLWAFDNQYSFTLPNTTVKVKKLKLRPSPIAAKYKEPGMAKLLGKPVGKEDFCGDWVGQYQQYKNGVIYWSGKKNAKAFEVHGEILKALLAGEGFGSPDLPTDVAWYLSDLVLGNYPTSDVLTFPDGGQASHFQGCGLFWKANLGACWVNSPAFDAYQKLGGPKGALGFPLGTNTVYPPAASSDFENGTLDGATQLRAYDSGVATNAFEAAAVLKVVRKAIHQVIDKQNAANPSDPRIAINEDATFRSPMLTDYSFVGTNLQPRMYRIQQKLMVWAGPNPIAVSFSFELALVAGGAITGGTDIRGNPVKGTSPASVQPSIYNVTASVDAGGLIPLPKSDVKQIHDKIVGAVTGAALSPIPLPIQPASVKVLTTGAGVGLTSKTAPKFDVEGALVVLFG